MIDERELAQRPIVTETVQHNARVSLPLSSSLSCRVYRLRCCARASMHTCVRACEAGSVSITTPTWRLASRSSAATTIPPPHSLISPHPHPSNRRTNTPAQTVSNIRALTASLFGVAAGTLGLESYPGFIFYMLGTTLVSLLIYFLKTDGDAGKFFYSPRKDLWVGDMFGGVMSFVLTWTLFYGLCKA